MAPEALNVEQAVAELASQFSVHPTMIHSWKKRLLEGASGVFERGGKKASEIDEGQVKKLHAKIGELAVAKGFFGQKAQALGREVRHGMIASGNSRLSIGK